MKVRTFIAEHCILDPEAETAIPDLFAAWQAAGGKTTPRKFGLDMTKEGHPRGRRLSGNGPHVRVGVRLRGMVECVGCEKEIPEPEAGPAVCAGCSRPRAVGGPWGPEPHHEGPEPPTGVFTNVSRETEHPAGVDTTNPPPNLSEAAAAWWRSFGESYALKDHQRMTLSLAAQAWDRSQALEQALAVYLGPDGAGALSDPEAGRLERLINATAKSYTQLVRELGVDQEAGRGREAPRKPRTAGLRSKR